MAVVQIENGVVVAAWFDVSDTTEWVEKYYSSYGNNLYVVNAPDEGVAVGFTYDNGVFTPPVLPVTEGHVMYERDRRIDQGTHLSVTGIGLVPVSGRQSVQMDLQGLATAASLAKQAGNATAVFPFRDENNVVHMMNPDQVIELYMAGVQWVSQVKAASWALVDSNEIPRDYRDDTYWP